MEYRDAEMYRENTSESEEDLLAAEVFGELVGGAQGDFERVGYLCGSYRDSSGRYLEDVRLCRDRQGAGFFLNANIGEALGLIELGQKLRERGVKINYLVRYMASREEQKKMDEWSAFVK